MRFSILRLVRVAFSIYFCVLVVENPNPPTMSGQLTLAGLSLFLLFLFAFDEEERK